MEHFAGSRGAENAVVGSRGAVNAVVGSRGAVNACGREQRSGECVW